MESTEYLIPILHKYFQDNPLAAAHNLETLTEEQAGHVLAAIPASNAAAILAHLSPTFASSLVLNGSVQNMARILERGGSEACSSILLNLDPANREEFLKSLSKKARDQIQEILSFPEGSAGRVMKTDYTAFNVDLTVKEAASKLTPRKGKQRAPSNIYVTDASKKLLGVIAMRDLVIATGSTRLADIMRTDLLTVGGFDEAEMALKILSGRGFTSLPVVDAQGRLLGVVRATNLLEKAQEDVSEDIQKLFGVGKNEKTFSPIGFCLRKRLPWLHVNLATAFLAASVVALFEGIIAKVTVLAIYLPVVAGQGGNAGAQSLAVVMRGLVMREIPPWALPSYSRNT